MTKKEKYYILVALQTILKSMKWKDFGTSLLPTESAEEHNKPLDKAINYLEDLKGKIHG